MMDKSVDHHEFVASETEVKIEIEEFNAIAHHESAIKTEIKEEVYKIEEQTNPCNEDASVIIKDELDENSFDEYCRLNKNMPEDHIVTDLKNKIDINNFNFKTEIKEEVYEIKEETNPCNGDISFTIKMELDENSPDAYYGINISNAEDQIITDLESKIYKNNFKLKTETCAEPLDISGSLPLEDANNFPSRIKLGTEENLIPIKSSLLQNCSSVEKLYVRDLCNKNFSNQNKADKHKQKHSVTKPYKCEFCSMSFVWPSHLKRHIRSHTEEKPYLCNICNKGFARASDLTRHKRLHTGEKPFLCEFCKKGFSLSGNLKVHRRSHTGDKPFVCDTCNKGFAQSGSLTVHKRLHTGDKPYVCDSCKKGFANSSNLNRHKTTHTVNKN